MSTTQNAVASITYADVAGFPAGSVVDHVLVTCDGTVTANSQPSQTVPPGTVTVTFANLTPDTYTLTAQAFSPVSGSGYGTAVSTTITITSTATISLSLPASMSASQP